MIKWARRIGFLAALAFLILTIVNASWVVSAPVARPKLIANGGIAQQYADRSGDCPAQSILSPLHTYLEDTPRSLRMAWRMGADMIAIDVAATADGQVVLFPDRDLGCRTNGQGPLSEASMLQLRDLDMGYGYSADGGKTFPLRGKGVGMLSTLDDVLADMPRAHFLYRVNGAMPDEGERLAARLRMLGRDPVTAGDAFTGNEAAVAALGEAFPGAWTVRRSAADACTGDYRLTGWSHVFTPQSCANGTLVAPLDRRFSLWGWPNRLLQRMASVNARVLLVARERDWAGLTHARQLGEIPVGFNDAVMVDDYWTVGPALRPGVDGRTNAEAMAAQERDEVTD